MTFITYKGIQIVDPTPTGEGGQALNDNFTTHADSIEQLTDDLDTVEGTVAAHTATLTSLDAEIDTKADASALTTHAALTTAHGATAAATANTIVLRDASGGAAFDDITATGVVTRTAANIQATSTDGIVLTNPTPSAFISPRRQWSPRLRFHGSAFQTSGGAVSDDHDWIIENRTTDVSQPGDESFSSLVIGFSISGGAYVLPLTITTGNSGTFATSSVSVNRLSAATSVTAASITTTAASITTAGQVRAASIGVATAPPQRRSAASPRRSKSLTDRE